MSNFEVIQPSGDDGGKGVPIFMWNKGVKFEEQAIEQLTNLSRMPFIYKHVAAMPDCHWGMGSTVGSVFATVDAVIPAAVGVDIGCGMIAVKTDLKVANLQGTRKIYGEDHTVLSLIRREIETMVPMGRTNNGQKGDRGAWTNVPEVITDQWEYAAGEHDLKYEVIHDPESMSNRYESLISDHPELKKANALVHLGTLGTGNHFIEIQRDTDDNIWVMLHSGSRGIGNKIGQYFINKAKSHMKKWHILIPDPDLAFLPKGEEDYHEYLTALHFAQDFALLNRHIMMHRVLKAIETIVGNFGIDKPIQTHHNYAAFEKHFGKSVLLTRKGAVNAEKDRLGIIPGSMGTRSYIVRGLGNPLSFNSCSHGAGRAMSRTAAIKSVSLERHRQALEGVECNNSAETLDETPMAYKDIDAVIEAEKDLVEPIVTLKQLLCCKGIS